MPQDNPTQNISSLDVPASTIVEALAKDNPELATMLADYTDNLAQQLADINTTKQKVAETQANALGQTQQTGQTGQIQQTGPTGQEPLSQDISTLLQGFLGGDTEDINVQGILEKLTPFLGEEATRVPVEDRVTQALATARKEREDALNKYRSEEPSSNFANIMRALGLGVSGFNGKAGMILLSGADLIESSDPKYREAKRRKEYNDLLLSRELDSIDKQTDTMLEILGQQVAGESEFDRFAKLETFRTASGFAKDIVDQAFQIQRIQASGEIDRKKQTDIVQLQGQIQRSLVELEKNMDKDIIMQTEGFKLSAEERQVQRELFENLIKLRTQALSEKENRDFEERLANIRIASEERIAGVAPEQLAEDLKRAELELRQTLASEFADKDSDEIEVHEIWSSVLNKAGSLQQTLSLYIDESVLTKVVGEFITEKKVPLSGTVSSKPVPGDIFKTNLGALLRHAGKFVGGSEETKTETKTKEQRVDDLEKLVLDNILIEKTGTKDENEFSKSINFSEGKLRKAKLLAEKIVKSKMKESTTIEDLENIIAEEILSGEFAESIVGIKK